MIQQFKVKWTYQGKVRSHITYANDASQAMAFVARSLHPDCKMIGAAPVNKFYKQ